MRLVYLHQNKCGGTTLQKVLVNLFGRDEVCFVEDVIAAQGSYRKLPTEHLLRVRFFHDAAGLQAYHENVSGVRYLFVYREPLARLYSEWKMLTRYGDAELAGNSTMFIERARAREGFSRYLELTGSDPSPGWRNSMAKMLFLDRELVTEISGDFTVSSDEFILARSIANLGLIDYLCPVENLDFAVSRISSDLGLPSPGAFQSFNKGGGANDVIEDSDRKRAYKHLELDYYLYEECKKKYGEMASLALETESANRSRPSSPKWFGLNFSGAVPGFGFHAKEVNSGRATAWLGPDTECCLYFDLDCSLPIKVEVLVTNYLAFVQVGLMKAYLSEIEVALKVERLKDNCYLLHGLLSGGDFKNSNLELRLTVPFTRRPSALDDERLLGVEISHIAVYGVET